MAYINEAAAENGIDRHIRYRHRVLAADWSDAENRWTLTVEHDGETPRDHLLVPVRLHGLLQLRRGLFARRSPAREDFAGTIVHPQHWPEDLDYAGQEDRRHRQRRHRGHPDSGAGANSGAGHVTMLQRSPTYIGSLPGVDPFAEQVNRLLPDHLAHMVNRWKAIAFSTFQYQLARKVPAYMRKTLMTMAERRLPEGL